MRGRVHLRARAPALRRWKMKSIFDSNFHKSIQKIFYFRSSNKKSILSYEYWNFSDISLTLRVACSLN